MEQLLETSELKIRLCHRRVINRSFKFPYKETQYASLLNKVFFFSVILLQFVKYFCYYEFFLPKT